MRPRVAAGFTTGFANGAGTGFWAGSIILLQGNIVKVFVKVKVLKSQEVKCRCTYGDTLPRGYLQVAWWWQRWCIRIRYNTSWGSLRPGSSTSTCVNHRLHCSSFGVPAKTIIPVYSHLGTHATSVVNSPKSKIITMTYECTEPSSAALSANGTVCHLFIRSTLGDHRLFTRTTGN